MSTTTAKPGIITNNALPNRHDTELGLTPGSTVHPP